MATALPLMDRIWPPDPPVRLIADLAGAEPVAPHVAEALPYRPKHLLS